MEQALKGVAIVTFALAKAVNFCVTFAIIFSATLITFCLGLRHRIVSFFFLLIVAPSYMRTLQNLRDELLELIFGILIGRLEH